MHAPSPLLVSGLCHPALSQLPDQTVPSPGSNKGYFIGTVLGLIDRVFLIPVTVGFVCM